MPHAFLDELSAGGDMHLVLTHSLFSGVPYIFDGDRTAWSTWKTELARGLDVDPHSVMLVGSSAVGVSLNPTQGFKPFRAGSDIDVAVVSTRHFDSAWHTLRSLGVRIFRLPKQTQLEIREHAPGYVYWGVIATDKILGVLEFGPRWKEALEEMRHRDPTRDRTIRVRLYRDISSLRAYQLRSLKSARDRLDNEKGLDD